jgi:hypothetical protein
MNVCEKVRWGEMQDTVFDLQQQQQQQKQQPWTKPLTRYSLKKEKDNQGRVNREGRKSGTGHESTSQKVGHVNMDRACMFNQLTFPLRTNDEDPVIQSMMPPLGVRC